MLAISGFSGRSYALARRLHSGCAVASGDFAICPVCADRPPRHTLHLLANLAIALFALVAIESGSHLGRTYAALLVCALLLDILWFIFFSYEIRRYGRSPRIAIFSVELALWMEIIGFTRSFSALTDVHNPILGGSIYDPTYYASLADLGEGELLELVNKGRYTDLQTDQRRALNMKKDLNTWEKSHLILSISVLSDSMPFWRQHESGTRARGDGKRYRAEEVLFKLVNYHLQKAGSPREITDFSSDLKISKIHTIEQKQCLLRLSINCLKITVSTLHTPPKWTGRNRGEDILSFLVYWKSIRSNERDGEYMRAICKSPILYLGKELMC
ncbi:hypothetical protein SELMODRAFT_424859 [Selaginella moellendorffii]|uniref:Uncharacterized protein n=1 Tax=Selaginella moellendorffii TaxID=88036 RepID=D8SR88_SELML|nr:hypothetical protein SELMODRAFT_424859 [Selaginella moellendorffii]